MIFNINSTRGHTGSLLVDMIMQRYLLFEGVGVIKYSEKNVT